MKFRVPTLPVIPLLLALAAPSAQAGFGDFMAKYTGLICGVAWKGLQKTEIENRQAVWMDKLLAPWAKIEPYLQMEASTVDIAKKLIEVDARASVFQSLEQWKFYADMFDDTDLADNLERMIKRMNRLEDVLGIAVDASKVPAKLTKIGLSAETVAKAQIHADETLQQLVELLEDDGWIGPNAKALRKMTELFDRLDLPSQMEDAEYLEKAITAHAEAIREYPFNRAKPTLQNDVHKMKRLLRKLSLLKLAARGKIISVTPAKMPPSLAPYQNVSEISRKFMIPEVSPFEIKRYVIWNAYAENALSVFIDRFNLMKDNGELIEIAVRFAMESGEFTDDRAAHAEIAKKIIAAYPAWTPWELDAKKAFEDFFRSEMLDLLLIKRDRLSPGALEQIESTANKR